MQSQWKRAPEAGNPCPVAGRRLGDKQNLWAQETLPQAKQGLLSQGGDDFSSGYSLYYEYPDRLHFLGSG